MSSFGSGSPGSPLRAFGGYGSTPAPQPFSSQRGHRSLPQKSTGVTNPNLVREQLRQSGGLLLCMCTLAVVGVCLALALVAMVDPPMQRTLVPSMPSQTQRQVTEICFSGGWTWNRMEWRYSDGSVDVVGFVDDASEETALPEGGAVPKGGGGNEMVLDFVGDPLFDDKKVGEARRRLERRHEGHRERHAQRRLVQRIGRRARRLGGGGGASEGASATAVHSTSCTEPLTLDTAHGEYITAVEGFDTNEDSDKYIGCEHRITTSTGRVQEWKKTDTAYCTGEQLDATTRSPDPRLPSFHFVRIHLTI